MPRYGFATQATLAEEMHCQKMMTALLGQAGWAPSQEYVDKLMDETWMALPRLGANASVLKERLLQAVELAGGAVQDVPGGGFEPLPRGFSIDSRIGLEADDVQCVKVWLMKKMLFYPRSFYDILLKMAEVRNKAEIRIEGNASTNA